jgi:hypothetical protein
MASKFQNALSTKRFVGISVKLRLVSAEDQLRDAAIAAITATAEAETPTHPMSKKICLISSRTLRSG